MSNFIEFNYNTTSKAKIERIQNVVVARPKTFYDTFSQNITVTDTNNNTVIIRAMSSLGYFLKNLNHVKPGITSVNSRRYDLDINTFVVVDSYNNVIINRSDMYDNVYYSRRCSDDSLYQQFFLLKNSISDLQTFISEIDNVSISVFYDNHRSFISNIISGLKYPSDIFPTTPTYNDVYVFLLRVLFTTIQLFEVVGSISDVDVTFSDIFKYRKYLTVLISNFNKTTYIEVYQNLIADIFKVCYYDVAADFNTKYVVPGTVANPKITSIHYHLEDSVLINGSAKTYQRRISDEAAVVTFEPAPPQENLLAVGIKKFQLIGIVISISTNVNIETLKTEVANITGDSVVSNVLYNFVTTCSRSFTSKRIPQLIVEDGNFIKKEEMTVNIEESATTCDLILPNDVFKCMRSALIDGRFSEKLFIKELAKKYAKIIGYQSNSYLGMTKDEIMLNFVYIGKIYRSLVMYNFISPDRCVISPTSIHDIGSDQEIVIDNVTAPTNLTLLQNTPQNFIVKEFNSYLSANQTASNITFNDMLITETNGYLDVLTDGILISGNMTLNSIITHIFGTRVSNDALKNLFQNAGTLDSILLLYSTVNSKLLIVLLNSTDYFTIEISIVFQNLPVNVIYTKYSAIHRSVTLNNLVGVRIIFSTTLQVNTSTTSSTQTLSSLINSYVPGYITKLAGLTNAQSGHSYESEVSTVNDLTKHNFTTLASSISNFNVKNIIYYRLFNELNTVTNMSIYDFDYQNASMITFLSQSNIRKLHYTVFYCNVSGNVSMSNNTHFLIYLTVVDTDNNVRTKVFIRANNGNTTATYNDITAHGGVISNDLSVGITDNRSMENILSNHSIQSSAYLKYPLYVTLNFTGQTINGTISNQLTKITTATNRYLSESLISSSDVTNYTVANRRYISDPRSLAITTTNITVNFASDGSIVRQLNHFLNSMSLSMTASTTSTLKLFGYPGTQFTDNFFHTISFNKMYVSISKDFFGVDNNTYMVTVVIMNSSVYKTMTLQITINGVITKTRLIVRDQEDVISSLSDGQLSTTIPSVSNFPTTYLVNFNKTVSVPDSVSVPDLRDKNTLFTNNFLLYITAAEHGKSYADNYLNLGNLPVTTYNINISDGQVSENEYLSLKDSTNTYQLVGNEAIGTEMSTKQFTKAYYIVFYCNSSGRYITTGTYASVKYIFIGQSGANLEYHSYTENASGTVENSMTLELNEVAVSTNSYPRLYEVIFSESASITRPIPQALTPEQLFTQVTSSYTASSIYHYNLKLSFDNDAAFFVDQFNIAIIYDQGPTPAPSSKGINIFGQSEMPEFAQLKSKLISVWRIKKLAITVGLISDATNTFVTEAELDSTQCTMANVSVQLTYQDHDLTTHTETSFITINMATLNTSGSYGAAPIPTSTYTHLRSSIGIPNNYAYYSASSNVTRTITSASGNDNNWIKYPAKFEFTFDPHLRVRSMETLEAATSNLQL